MDGPARRAVGGRRRPILDPRCECFKIGEVARGLDTTPSAIRFYQKRFAPHIRPTRIATKSRRGTYRYVYSQRDVQVLKVILTLRRDHGLSIKDTRERLHDLLVTHHGDPFAIERDLVPPSEESHPSVCPTAPPSEAGRFPDQGELPFDAAPATRCDDGVREPPTAVPSLADRIQDLERRLEDAQRAIEAREREVAEARRAADEQAARLRETERALQRSRLVTSTLRVRIRQAVQELLLDAMEESPEDGA